MLMNPQWMKTDTIRQTVEVYPPDSVQRRWVKWGGIAAEIVAATRRERLEFHFRAAVHPLWFAIRACAATATRSWRACRDRSGATCGGG